MSSDARTDIDRAEAFLEAGDLAAARRLCDAILAADPSQIEANHLVGAALQRSGELHAALARFEIVTSADPSHGDAWFRRGAVLIALARFTDAASCLRRLLALWPDDGEGLLQYGFCLCCLGDFDAARPALEQAHARIPDDDSVLFLLAMTMTWTGDPARALIPFEALTSRSPDFAAGWNGRGLLLLLLGRYGEGWPMHEWRLKLTGNEGPARIDRHPRWRSGMEARGKTVLLHGDVGLGDIIQLARYVPMVAASGVRVVLRVPRELIGVMGSLPGVAAIIGDSVPLPHFDLQCPIMSLPFAFGTTLETIPAHGPYLWPKPDVVATWRARFTAVHGLRVGLAWAAAPRLSQISNQAFARRKSTSLATLAPLGQVQSVTFVMLQMGLAANEARPPPANMALLDMTGEIKDFEDTAAIIANLDLVISVDTSVAHMAGAMGKPVWLMNVFDTDWRWMLNRDDNPWYPTMRIFRQPVSGDWISVAADVAAALRGVVMERGRSVP